MRGVKVIFFGWGWNNANNIKVSGSSGYIVQGSQLFISTPTSLRPVTGCFVAKLAVSSRSQGGTTQGVCVFVSTLNAGELTSPKTSYAYRCILMYALIYTLFTDQF